MRQRGEPSFSSILSKMIAKLLKSYCFVVFVDISQQTRTMIPNNSTTRSSLPVATGIYRFFVCQAAYGQTQREHISWCSHCSVSWCRHCLVDSGGLFAADKGDAQRLLPELRDCYRSAFVCSYIYIKRTVSPHNNHNSNSRS